jgi:hypothetical protein
LGPVNDAMLFRNWLNGPLQSINWSYCPQLAQQRRILLYQLRKNSSCQVSDQPNSKMLALNPKITRWKLAFNDACWWWNFQRTWSSLQQREKIYLVGGKILAAYFW